jgi:hypothetical protein
MPIKKKQADVKKQNKDPVAALRLKIYAVWEQQEDENWEKCWDQFNHAWRRYQQGVQKAMGDVLIHIRNLRASGKVRFATPEEKKKTRLPNDCYRPEDLRLDKPFYNGVKDCGVHSMIYAQGSKVICDSEFQGEKLKSLLRGETSYPTLRPPLYVHNCHYRIYFEEREGKDKEGNPKTFEVPVVEINNLFSGGRPVAFEAWGLTGRGADGKNAILEALSQSKSGWKQRALSIHRVQRPGARPEWYLQIAYSSPRTLSKTKKSVAIVHRGVVHPLNILVIDRDGLKFHSYPGHRIVRFKRQMYARRRRLLQDIATCRGTGRGKAYTYRPMVKLGDKEKKFTQTEIWKMVREVRRVLDDNRPELVVLDNFSTQMPEFHKNGVKIVPYVRKWPYAAFLAKCEDALRRRTEVNPKVVKQPAPYISQTCPLCEHTAKENVLKLPSTNRPEENRDGQFSCIKCGHSQPLEATALCNLALGSESVPTWAKTAIKNQLEKVKKYKDKYKKDLIKELVTSD